MWNNDNEWAAVTKEGYFNASQKGSEFINVRAGNEVLLMDNFFQKFYDPFVVSQKIQNVKIQTIENINDSFETPPEVQFLSPTSGDQFNQEEISIVVEANDQGNGIGNILLYHNGAVLGESRGFVKKNVQNSVQKSFNVRLLSGENIFKLIAYSNGNTASQASEMILYYSGSALQPDLYLFGVYLYS